MPDGNLLIADFLNSLPLQDIPDPIPTGTDDYLAQTAKELDEELNIRERMSWLATP